MRKKDIIMIVALICSLSFGLIQYLQNSQLKAENKMLVEKDKRIEANIGKEDSNKGNEEIKAGEIEIVEGFNLEMFDNYNNFPSIPAYGPLCELNAYGINNTKAVKIIGKENDFLTRISIEGVIPTWAIKDENISDITYIDNRIMYFLNECDVFLTPEENSESVFSVNKGNSVTVTGEYDEWYFITMNYSMGSNIFNYGWVKKSSLGYYDQFKSNIGLEVNVRKGSPIKYEGEEDVQIIKDYSTWGRIMEETELEYVLAMPGASVATVEKKYVEPFSTGDQ